MKTDKIMKVGDKVVDRDGFQGVIVGQTVCKGAVWYFDVRFDRGVAVRFPNDLSFR